MKNHIHVSPHHILSQESSVPHPHEFEWALPTSRRATFLGNYINLCDILHTMFLSHPQLSWHEPTLPCCVEDGQPIKQQQDVLEQHARFYHFFYNAPISMVVVNCRTRIPTIVAVNRRTEHLLGYAAQQLINLPVTCLATAEMNHELLNCLAQLKHTWSFTMDASAICYDGTSFPARFQLTADMMQNTSNIIIAIEACSPAQVECEKAKLIASERQRIAHEIHDGVAQDLAALSLEMRLSQQQAGKGEAQHLSSKLEFMRQTLDEVLVELRRTICGLRPVPLEEQGLVVALHSLAAEFSAQYPIYIHLNIDGDEDYLPHTAELPLFRVAQESLNNIVQHAKATLIQLTLTITPDQVAISIQDNGCGFTTDTLLRKKRCGHLGLQQMQERIAALHGTLSIASEVGQGTHVIVTLES